MLSPPPLKHNDTKSRAARRSASRETAASVDPLLSRYLSLKRELDQRSVAMARSPPRSQPNIPAAISRTATPDARTVLQSPTADHKGPSRVQPSHQPLSDRTMLRLDRTQPTPKHPERPGSPISHQRVPPNNAPMNHDLSDVQRAWSSSDGGIPFSAQDNQHRVLEGKIEALESVVAQKDRLLDQEREISRALEDRVQSMGSEISVLQSALQAKERFVGETTVASDFDKQEISRLRQSLEAAQKNIAEHSAKCERLEAALFQKAAELDRFQHDRKDEHRARSAEQNQWEMRLFQAEERLREVEHAKERLVLELREKNLQNEQLQSAVKEAKTKYDALTVKSAQESIVADELKFELERHKTVLKDLRDELLQQDEAMQRHEESIHKLEADRRGKYQAEAQLAAARGEIDSVQAELERARREIETLNTKLQQAKQESEVVQQLEQRVGSLQSENQAKMLTIEKFNVTSKEHEEKILRLRQDLSQSQAREESALEEITKLQGVLRAQDQEKLRLGSQVEKLHSLQRDFVALRDQLESSAHEKAMAETELNEWQRRCHELDADVGTLLGVKRQFDDLCHERREMLMQLDTKEAELIELHREATVSSSRLKQREEELKDAQNLIGSLEAQIQRQQQQLHDKAAVETRLRQASNELAVRGEELSRERERREELSARLSQREEYIGNERAKRADLDAQVASLQQLYSSAQVDNGKMSVVIDTLTKESSRLQREIEHRAKQVELRGEEVAQLRKEFQHQEAELQAAVLKENFAQERVASLTDQLREIQENHKLRSGREVLDSQLREAEAALVSIRGNTDRERSQQRRIEELEVQLQRREAEGAEMSHLITQLREKSRDAANEASNVAKLRKKLDEMTATSERQSQLIATLEQNEASAAKNFLEKERELSRLREKLNVLQSDLDGEKSRKKSLESRIRDLEEECQRASALDGQVAGLHLVVAQRTKDLEDERAVNAELRNRLRAAAVAERSQSMRSASTTQEDAAKLSSKDELISQLEVEVRKRQAAMDDLHSELDRVMKERGALELQLREARLDAAKMEDQWRQRCSRLEQRLLDLQRGSSDQSGEITRLTGLVERLHRKNSEMTSELAATPPSNNDVAALLSTAQEELRVSNENAALLSRRLQEIQRNDNTTAVERPLVYQQHSELTRTIRTSSAPGLPVSEGPTTGPEDYLPSRPLRPSHPTKWDVVSAEEEIMRWRERRQRMQKPESVSEAPRAELHPPPARTLVGMSLSPLGEAPEPDSGSWSHGEATESEPQRAAPL